MAAIVGIALFESKAESGNRRDQWRSRLPAIALFATQTVVVHRPYGLFRLHLPDRCMFTQIFDPKPEGATRSNRLAAETRVFYAANSAEFVIAATPFGMDSIQQHHERLVGDQLIEWYNQRHSTSFRFDGRPGKAPDLRYRDGDHWLGVEVTSAYYDRKADPEFKWAALRQLPDAPKDWHGEDFDQFLVRDINAKIAARCRNSYGPNCLLAVYVDADMTRACDIELRIENVAVPATHRFNGIYVCGKFAVTTDSFFSGVRCDVRVWQLYPKAAL